MAQELNRRVTNPDGTISFVSGESPEAVSSAITSAALAPQKAIQVPQAPVDTTNYQGMVSGGNAAIDSYNTATAPKPDSSIEGMFTKYLGTETPPPSQSDAYSTAYDASGIDKIAATGNADKAAFDAVNAQLQGLNAEATAIPIQKQKDAEGRGITAAGLAPQTTAALRDNALKALPLQAEALVLQAKITNNTRLLQTAQDKLNTMFQLRMSDATAQYNYKKDLRDKVYEFASAQEKARLDSLQKKDDRAFEMTKLDAANQASLAKIAMESGQGALAAQIAALDPKSSSFKADLAALQGQVQSMAATKSALEIQKLQQDLANGAKPEVKTINGVDMQWNPKTKTWDAIGGASSTDQTQKTKDQLAFLRTAAKDSLSLASAAGPSAITRVLGDTFKGDTKFRQLEQQTNTLRVNVLALMTDPTIKKFFGPQMSNADVALMTSAGTTLNPQSNTPKQMQAELKRLDDLFIRMQNAVDIGTKIEASGGYMVVAPDGNQVQITD